MKWTTVAVLGSALLATGCGTIVRGTTEKVTVNTRPSGAAVTTSIGLSCPRAPCTFEVKRRRPFDAYATKPGYKKGEVHIGTKISKDGAKKLAGNLLLPGGSVGAAVDVVSGSIRDHDPNPALIVLEREGAKKPPRKRRGSPTS